MSHAGDSLKAVGKFKIEYGTYAGLRIGDLMASDLDKLARGGMGRAASKEANALCKACARAP